MPVFQINPLNDSRWRSFVENHPRASVFHSSDWLRALSITYGYAPLAFTTCGSGSPLSNAIVFCRIHSWLTGVRLVSLPFSDHCEPLVESREDLQDLLTAVRKGRFAYSEIRPRLSDLGACGLTAAGHYSFHSLDLRPSLEDLHSHFHKDGVQRKIRRADRENLVLSRGNSEPHLKHFYSLLLRTRRRHRLPPQPYSWFRNLADCMGDRLRIYLACTGERPIASILTLRNLQTMVYKYGCSDERFHNLGGMPWLFWKAIQDGKAENLRELDLGRSDEANQGLVKFKDHLGAARSTLTYWLLSEQPVVRRAGLSGVLKSPLVEKVLTSLPDSLFRLAGEIFYRHAG